MSSLYRIKNNRTDSSYIDINANLNVTGSTLLQATSATTVDASDSYKINNVNALRQDSTSVYVGNTGSGGTENVLIGYQAGLSISGGTDRIFIGYQAGYSEKYGGGEANVFLGAYAGYGNIIGYGNTYVGYRAGQQSTGGYNTFIGSWAGYRNTIGTQNIIISSEPDGYWSNAGPTTGSGNILMGTQNILVNGSSNNIILGNFNSLAGTNGDNIAIGNANGGASSPESQQGNISIGGGAMAASSLGTYGVAIGYQANVYNSSGTGNVNIGYRSNGYGHWGFDFPNNYTTSLGSFSLYNNKAGYNVAIGYQAGYANTTGDYNIFLGNQAGVSETVGADNIIIANGHDNGYFNVGGNIQIATGSIPTGLHDIANNIVIGNQASRGNHASNNIAIGGGANSYNTTGANNVDVGTGAGGAGNWGSAYAKNNNVSIGHNALFYTRADNNVAVGYQAGYFNTTGVSSVFLGYQAGYNEALPNRLYISNSNTAAPLIYGEFDNKNLTINGNLTVTGNTTLKGNLDVVEANINVTGNTTITGDLIAGTKSFVIPHPTKPGKKLHYGSLESPYHGVQLTGEGVLIKGKAVVKLPDYICKLVHQKGCQVHLTNIKHNKVIWVDNVDINNNQFTVKTKIGFWNLKKYSFFWSFVAVRKDVKEIIVEE